jgi:hypothetical protein
MASRNGVLEWRVPLTTTERVSRSLRLSPEVTSPPNVKNRQLPVFSASAGVINVPENCAR